MFEIYLSLDNITEFPLSWTRDLRRLRLSHKRTYEWTLACSVDCFETVNTKMNASPDNKASSCTCSIQPPLLCYSKLNPPVSLTKLIPESKCFYLQALCALCCSILMFASLGCQSCRLKPFHDVSLRNFNVSQSWSWLSENKHDFVVLSFMLLTVCANTNAPVMQYHLRELDVNNCYAG